MASARALSVCAVTGVMLLAACQAPHVHTAPETVSTIRHLRQEPLRAAACIARNVDRYRSPYSAQIRPAAAPASAEVLIRGSDTVAIARLFSAGPASQVEIRRTGRSTF